MTNYSAYIILQGKDKPDLEIEKKEENSERIAYFESSSSIRGNVKIWKLNEVKEFLHMLRLQYIPIEVK